MSENNGNTPKVQRQLYAKKGAWFGKVYVEFGVTQAFEFANAEEQHAGFLKLLSMCEFELNHYAEDFKRAPQNYGQRAGENGAASGATDAETEPVLEIALNINNGEKQYRVKTPKSHQYGYPIYEDCPCFATFLAELGGEFSAKPKDFVATTIKQGKGRKVISFEKKF